MREAKRLQQLPPYLFAAIDKKKAEAVARGVDIISLGIGDPDRPTPDFIVDALAEAAREPSYHRYPAYEGSRFYRQAVADFYKRRFNVDLDPDREVLALIGSKEGIAHIFFALLDAGECALLPDPAYPVYKTSAILCGGIPVAMPLTRENGFVADPEEALSRAPGHPKLMFLNYPNNPTAATVDLSYFERVVAFAREREIVLCHDNAYSEMTFDGFTAPSVLQVPGAKDIAVEFGSLSKPFNMTGWRIGYVVGNAEVIASLGKLKTNLDSGQFTAIQKAAAVALNAPPDSVEQMKKVYQERRDVAVPALQKMGFAIEKPRGTFYLWVPVPPGYTSASFATHLLEQAGVIVGPGNAYGDYGEGYIRIALTVEIPRLEEALERIRKVL